MAEFREVIGNIFNSDCSALVNPVNTVGVMGAGLAKQFKIKYPVNYFKYVNSCNNNNHKLVVGTCLTTIEQGKYIINVPTKIHYKDPSTYEIIQQSLDALVKHIIRFNITSIAIPKLGCGLGGLDFNIVKVLIMKKLKSLDITVELYIN